METMSVLVPDCYMHNGLKNLRTASRLSYQKIADVSGTTAKQIERLEKGERTLTPEWVAKIASGMGIEPHLIDPSYIYTAEEQAFLDLYRSLPQEKRSLFFDMLEGAARKTYKHKHDFDDPVAGPPEAAMKRED